MKNVFKVFVVMVFVGLLFSMPATAQAAEKGQTGKFFIKAGLNVLMPGDSTFKELYGNSQMVPEAKVGFFFTKKVYVWGGFGAFSKTGELVIFDTVISTEVKQRFLSGGVGYSTPVTDKFNFRVEAGVVSFHVEEDALDMNITDNAIGFRGDVGVTYAFGKSFFCDLYAGYMTASDTVNDYDVKYGGLYSGLMLGVRF